MAHKWVIRKSANGEYRAYFEYNGEKIWWSEGYSNKSAAQNAIEAAKRNGPGALVQAFQEDELQKFKDAMVASADLILRPDHKSAEFREFEKALFKFTDKISTANDLQNLENDDLEVARNELVEIKEASSKRAIRAEAIWNKTKSTAVWISEKAADGVVKALAVKLLKALANLLGIPIG